jgi:hypothetical protein
MNPLEHGSRVDPSALSVPLERLRALADAELSLPARFAHVALLLVSSAFTVALGSLWVTEPHLPARTHAAFGSLLVIAVSWSGYATWVLTNRRALLARHRVVAGRMAVTFTAIFALGAALVGVSTGRTAAFAAAGLGVVMFAIALVLLARARRRFHALVERRARLEYELGTQR